MLIMEEFKKLFKMYKKIFKYRQIKQISIRFVCFEELDIENYLKDSKVSFQLNVALIYFYIHNFIKRGYEVLCLGEYVNKKTGEIKAVKKIIDFSKEVNLSATYLKFYETNYTNYISFLCEKVGFSKVRDHCKGKYSKAFSYKEKYPKLKFVEANNNYLLKRLFFLTRKYHQLRKANFNDSFYLTKLKPLLDDYQYLSIDLKAVKKYLDEKLDIWLLNKGSVLKVDFDYNDYVRDFLGASQVANGFYKFKREKGNSDGRLHSEFQNLSKRMRQFVKLDNKPMYEADISAAVPTIFIYYLNKLAETAGEAQLPNNPNSITIKKDIETNHLMLLDLHKKIDNDINEQNIIKNLQIALPITQSQIWLREFTEELKDFKEHIFNDTLYQSFIEEYANSFIPADWGKAKDKQNKFISLFNTNDEKGMRNLMKKQFLSFLNADTESCSKYNRIKDIFKGRYPLIFAVLKEIKNIDLEKKHKLFSILVLQMESKLILEIVCLEFKEMYPDCKLITIHDCILTTEEYIDELNSFMKDRISKELGININSKMKLVTTVM